MAKKKVSKSNKKTRSKKSDAKKTNVKKAKSKSNLKVAPWEKLKFEGLTLAFAGREKKWHQARKDLESYATGEGAKVVAKVSKNVDWLIVMDAGATAKPKQEAQKLIKQGEEIEIISEEEFRDRIEPTSDDVIAMLKAGPKGLKRLEILRDACQSNSHRNSRSFLISNVSLKGIELSDLTFTDLNFEDIDFRNAKVGTLQTTPIFRCNFQNATGDHFRPASLIDCNCRNVKWRSMYLGFGRGGKELYRTDLTNADLRHSYFTYSIIKDSQFTKTHLMFSKFSSAEVSGSNFDKADLTGAELRSTDFSKNNSFVGTNFTSANLQYASLRNANLKNANFSKTNLQGARFDRADLTNTNFKDAILIGTDFGKADISKAKNLNIPQPRKFRLPPACKEINDGVGNGRIVVEFNVQVPCGDATVWIGSSEDYHNSPGVRYQIYVDKKKQTSRFITKTMTAAFKKAGDLFSHGELDLASIKCKTTKSKLKGKALQDLAVTAISAIFGTTTASKDSVKAAKLSAKQKSESIKAEIRSELLGGKSGIKKFNQRDLGLLAVPKANKLSNEDFSKANMDGLSPSLSWLSQEKFSIEKSNFQNVSMKKAKIENFLFTGSNFQNANLSGSSIHVCEFKNCDFSNSKLNSVHFEFANLRGSDLKGANLTGTKFDHASLQGVDFSNAKTSKTTTWEECDFDNQTVFPDKFVIPQDFIFSGKGHDPRKGIAAPKTIASVKTFDDFMQHLSASVEKGRLDKALKMLKKESFELFNEVSKDSFVGVVKSQSDSDLVYSCQLTKAGEFTCCTQNLKSCGGLRGAMCKHILVMLVGLTKTKKLKPKLAVQWSQLSEDNKLMLDKDLMASVLLKYKGAEAGDIDWRPVETVPEDFMAF